MVCLVCSANSTLKSLDVSGNPMSEAARKAVQLELVLCQMRNPEVTQINASNKGFDDQEAIKIGEGLRYVFIFVSGVFLSFQYSRHRNFLSSKRHFFGATRFFRLDIGAIFHEISSFFDRMQYEHLVDALVSPSQPNWRCGSLWDRCWSCVRAILPPKIFDY